MTCKCRTLVLSNCKKSDDLAELINNLNKQAKFYFVLYEKENVILERASLIDGTTKEIKKEKIFLINKLNKFKEQFQK